MSPDRTIENLRSQFSRIAAALLLFGIAGIASAQEPPPPLGFTTLNHSITKFVDEKDKPLPAFRYKWTDEKKWIERFPSRIPLPAEIEPAVGMRVWEHTASKSQAGGLKSTYETYCSELPIGVNHGVRYQYQVLPPETPEVYDLPDDDKGREEARMRAVYVRVLFAQNFKMMYKDDDRARAMQLAIWEVVHEREPRRSEQGRMRFDLREGTFQADYPDWDKAPKYVRDAQMCLEKLKFNEKLLQDVCEGRELVWLKGLPSPEAANGVPQSQFALKWFDVAANATEDGGLSGQMNSGTSGNGEPFGSSGSGRGNQSSSFQPGGSGAPPFRPGNTGAPFVPGVPGVGSPGPPPFPQTPVNQPRLIPGDNPDEIFPGRREEHRQNPLPGPDLLPDPKEVPAPPGVVLAGFALVMLAGRSLVKRHPAPPK